MQIEEYVECYSLHSETTLSSSKNRNFSWLIMILSWFPGFFSKLLELG